MATESQPSYAMGYIRGDTSAELGVQSVALNALCATTYIDKSDEESQLEACLKALRKGDTLIIFRLDRLARSLTDLQTILENLRERGIFFRSLSEHLDTSLANAEDFYACLKLLGGFEKRARSERTRTGLHKARALGRVGGRSPLVSERDKKAMHDLYHNKGKSVAQIIKKFGISRATFYRAILKDGYKCAKE